MRDRFVLALAIMRVRLGGVFTSDIAIIGRKRMNRRNSEVKIPIVPMYVQISTQVG